MKRLITERDVARLAAGTRLELEADALVTPAARDLAFIRGVVIVEPSRRAAEGGGTPPSCGCTGCAAGDGCKCGWPKLADGDYIVQVRGGRVQARRIDSPAAPTAGRPGA